MDVPLVLPGQKAAEPPLIYRSRLIRIVQVIVQMAIQILFIATSILMTGAAFPASVHGVVIPVVGFGSAVLAGFFFRQPKGSCGAHSIDIPLLVKPVVEEGAPLSPHSPRGLNRLRFNCAFNSLVHYLESDAQIADWLRHPLTPDMTMEAFEDFLAGYRQFADLGNDFRDYVLAQEPRRPIPDMFKDFLGGESSYFDQIRLVQESFSRFLAAYDHSMEENQRISAANSQDLRVALSRVTQRISPSEEIQVDAPEVLNFIVGLLPDAQKIVWQEAYDYGEEVEAPPRAPEPHGCIPLEISENEPPNLETMFHRFCDDANPGNHLVLMGHSFKALRCVRTLLEAPPALRFQIKRFYSRIGMLKGLKNWWLGVKNEAPVAVPNEITVPLPGGERRYRLASFINHHGATLRSGHYTSARIVEGERFLMNDTQVTLVDQEAWNRQLQQAYLLCYLPVPEQ